MNYVMSSWPTTFEIGPRPFGLTRVLHFSMTHQQNGYFMNAIVNWA
jgi:hypothetical protein